MSESQSKRRRAIQDRKDAETAARVWFQIAVKLAGPEAVMQEYDRMVNPPAEVPCS